LKQELRETLCSSCSDSHTWPHWWETSWCSEPRPDRPNVQLSSVVVLVYVLPSDEKDHTSLGPQFTGTREW